MAGGRGGGRAVRHHRGLPRPHGQVLLVLLRQQEVGAADTLLIIIAIIYYRRQDSLRHLFNAEAQPRPR